MMRRDRALEILKPRVDTQLVVAVYQTLFDWMAIHPRDLNYVATGAMGQASSHGLGLALANPEREVLVFDGDGSLLMNLGSLVSIADAAPANFHHFVFVNGVYEVNGAHPIPAAGKVDFAALARGAGYREIIEFDELPLLQAGIDAFLALPGPALAVMHIEAGAAYPRDYACIHSAEARERFRRALAAS
jgi:phosphonopyruvate decarboxylase